MRDVTLPTPIDERVLDLVERIPAGRVMAYGDIAAWFADEAAHAAENAEGSESPESAEEAGAGETAGVGTDRPRLGPRQVGRVMARYGGGVPWWRVLRADGTHAPGLEDEGLRRLRDEGTPMRAGGTRVDMAEARWDPASGEGVRDR
ncbi:MGMT family protein [Streptodolium elevatio]